jgi:hypothetical protein
MSNESANNTAANQALHRTRVSCKKPMDVFITSDSNWEAKIEHATRTLSLDAFFAERDYGPGQPSLSIVLMCRDPSLRFRRRLRLVHKKRRLYSDIMLDLPTMQTAGHAARRGSIAERLLQDIPPAIAKYRFSNFDLPAFSSDFKLTIQEQLLGADSSRYDHLCLERASSILGPNA